MKPAQITNVCSDDELQAISFKKKNAEDLCDEATPVKTFKQSLLSSFMCSNSERNESAVIGAHFQDSFSKPVSKIKLKRGRKRKNGSTSSFEVVSTAVGCLSNADSLNSSQSTDDMSLSTSPSGQNHSDSKNSNSLQKLGLKYEELKAAVGRTRQAYSVHKVSTYFCRDTNFIKEFGCHLLLAEQTVEKMGQVLGTVFSLDKSGTSIPVPADIISDISDEIIYLNEGDAEKRNQLQHHGSLTPPASEVGNYDNTSSLEDSCLSKKRKLTTDDTRNISSTEEAVKTRKLRNVKDRSLSPQKRKDAVSPPKYNNGLQLQKHPLNINVINNDDVRKVQDIISDIKSPENEIAEEYEVQKIKDYVKRQGGYCYRVSWKGYDSDDDTFEPADNLTGCDEELISFFYQRFLDRQNTEDPEELKMFLIPSDSRIKEQLYAAFEKFAYSLREYKSSSYAEKMINIILGTKVPTIKSKEELQSDLMKMLAVINPASERYVKLCSSLVRNINLLHVNQLREKQQAELRAWERNINIICSDPSPLTVENNIDLALPPLDFVYINGYLAGPNLSIPNDPLVGCECLECNASNKACCADQMTSYFAYSKYGRLRVSLGTPIYECNKLCKCPPDCTNRIVQKGRRISLSIFRTSNGRGWGVKTLEPIKKDTFVTEYVGEVITSEEAERRGTKYDAEGCTYLFDLDYNKGELNPYTVDAAKYGNVSHFINHSCDPNLVVYNVWVNCLDPDLPRLALFAVCDIKKGEEITFDYNSGSTRQVTASVAERIDQNGLSFAGTPTKIKELNAVFSSPISTPKKNNRGLIAGKTECHCGAPNCRKYFF